MAKTGRKWTALDKAAVKLLDTAREEDVRSLSYRQMSRMVGITSSRLSGLFLETMAPPTLDEFVELCMLFDKDPAHTLSDALALASASENAILSKPGSVDSGRRERKLDPQYIADHPEEFGLVAKQGDWEAEQEAYMEEP